MKKALFLILGSIFILCAQAQNMDELQVDKLHYQLANAKHDTVRIITLTKLAEAVRGEYADSTYLFASEALDLSRKNRFELGEMRSYVILSHYYFNLGDLSRALDLGLRSLEIAQKLGSSHDQAYAMIRVGNVYVGLKDYREAIRYFQWTRELTANTTDTFFHAVSYWRAADAYLGLKMIDSAIVFGRKAEDTARSMGNKFIQVGVSPIIGSAYSIKGMDSLALHYLRRDAGTLTTLYLGEFYQKRGQYDSALFYANKTYEGSIQYKVKQTEYRAALLLSSLYERTDLGKALQFHKIAMAAVDSMYGAEKVMSAQSVAYQMQERKRELEVAEMNLRNEVRTRAILLGLGAVAVIAFILYRNNRKERKTNQILNWQKAELSRTLDDLRATQAQLIQSEKMASLGELTAGIAHEIQNPLNFVNNFSDLNQELIDDLARELQKGDIREASVIAENLKENEAKINMHGKRADAIVKSMLQHSRSHSNHKEMTDMNKLVDEYVRLAFHGYRAKAKDFNVELDLDLDPQAGSLLILRQDIGRVLLNLLNNAFYAVNQRRQKETASYKPVVAVRTRREENALLIQVEDNGPGIPPEKREKIFQPFFTTKPTGEGTGLGLSLSYDIVTKSHGGSLEASSKEGEGAVFSIKLPLRSSGDAMMQEPGDIIDMSKT